MSGTTRTRETNLKQSKYEIAKVTIKKMLKAGLIIQQEFERIDMLNKNRFLVSTF